MPTPNASQGINQGFYMRRSGSGGPDGDDDEEDDEDLPQGRSGTASAHQAQVLTPAQPARTVPLMNIES